LQLLTYSPALSDGVDVLAAFSLMQDLRSKIQTAAANLVSAWLIQFPDSADLLMSLGLAQLVVNAVVAESYEVRLAGIGILDSIVRNASVEWAELCLPRELVEPLVALLPTVVEPIAGLVARLLHGLVELDVKMGGRSGVAEALAEPASVAALEAAVVCQPEEIADAVTCLRDLVGPD
jgi:hypothetical protein